MTEYPSMMIGVHLMIAHEQVTDVLERLEEEILEPSGDKKWAEGFKKGYKKALRDMFRELENEI